MTVLVLAAHPDDEVLGCGGTAARLSDEGHDVFFAIFGEGITSRYTQREQADQALLDRVHADSRRAAAILGAKDLFLHDLPDNRFDTIPLLDLVKRIEAFVEKLRPQVVFTQHGGDLNIDHVQLYRATLTATRPTAGTPVRTVYAYEVASSTEWAFAQFAPIYQPSVFFDIASTLERKIAAMQVYESELRAFPHPRSAESLRVIAKRWGSVSGLLAAEAFSVIRDLR
jgi:LmbE family N-acetylglucosaminyl deacetylase